MQQTEHDDNIRVGLVGPLPPPFGGIANQTRQLARLLRTEGLSVEVVQMNAPYKPAFVGRFRGARAIFRLVPYLRALWKMTRRVQVIHLMSNSGWSWHLFSSPAILIASLLRVPVVVNYRGGEAPAFMRAQARWIMPVMKKAAVLAVPSSFLAELFTHYGLLPRIVPNIVDLSRFDLKDIDKPPLGDAPKLIVTRNLEAIYDITTAIRAFALVRKVWPDAELAIAGSGPERRTLEAEVSSLELDDSVSFLGRLEVEEVTKLYMSAHIMLNPSTVDNTPNSVLEAWASGVAVVSTSVGGVPYLVRDGEDAILVPPENPEAMAQAVLNLLSDRTLYRHLVAAGRTSAKRFTWSEVRPLWLKVYKELVNKSSNSNV